SQGITKTELVPERAILAMIPWHKEEHLHILNIYAPNEHSANEAFWQELKDKLKGLPKPDLMLSDFNLVEDVLDRLPSHMDTHLATEALSDLKRELNLVDGWRAVNPDHTAFTFSQSRAQGGRQSHIDKIYITREALTYIKEWQIEPSGLPTDHQLVSAKVSDHHMPFVGKGIWTLPLFILNNKEVTETILASGKNLQQRIVSSQRERSEIFNPQTVFKEFKDKAIKICRSAAKKAIPKIQQRMDTLKVNLKLTLAD
ncbi:hypothetical protein HYDPIDRAFT_61309, partial [Hydnomerulius pinastri MD-312]